VPVSQPRAVDLLDWYDANRRRLPWRAEPGEVPDPYSVWLSEIMLQQTTVVTVIPYFNDFTARWPTVVDLAAANRDDILKAWAGLGYYARARNLHACARVVAEDHSGTFPATEKGLRALPGVGAYTAAAVAAIAFGEKATPVDGNIVRVTSRLFAVDEPMPKARSEIERLTAMLTPADRPGDFAQAMMDLGATICAPKSPKCLMCPWNTVCAAQKAGSAEAYPRKAPKKQRPTRYGICFWAEDGQGHVLVRTRPDKGLLGGMTEIPSTDWQSDPWDLSAAIAEGPVRGEWILLDGDVNHTFTHFHLVLKVMRAKTARFNAPEMAWWAKATEIGLEALPTVMKKVVNLAQSANQES